MTKADIVDIIYETLGISKKDIYKVVDSVFNKIKDEILSKNNVKISGLVALKLKPEEEELVETQKLVKKKLLKQGLLFLLNQAGF